MERPRKNITTIKVGTWEDKNVRCPAANTKSPQQFFADINEECGTPTDSNKARRDRRRRNR